MQVKIIYTDHVEDRPEWIEVILESQPRIA